MTVAAGIGYANLSPEVGHSFGGLAIAIGYEDGKKAFHLFCSNVSASGTNQSCYYFDKSILGVLN